MLFRGEIKLDDELNEVIPFTARMNDLVGELLDVREVADAASGGVKAMVRNVIESPIRINYLTAMLHRGETIFPGEIRDLSTPVTLGSGEEITLTVAPSAPLVEAGSLHGVFDLNGVEVLPDPEKVWNAILDPNLPAEYLRSITVKTFREMFTPSPDRPGNQIMAILVEFERGDTVELNADKLEAKEDIVNFFRTDPRSLPLEVNGKIEGLELDGFAEAITDRIRVRFGAFVPAPEKDVKPYLSLASPEEVGSGIFEWDLSEPIQAPRPLILHLDPLEAARELVRDHGLEAIVRETVVPPIQTGVLPIWISANLPAHRLGILALGVTIHAPPCPPHRVHTIVESAELHPPEDSTMIRLRLSPAEKLEYTFSTFVVIRDATGIERLEGGETSHQGSRLDLSPDDFPVSFVSIGASRGLLELAAVHGICRRPEGESEVEQPFELAFDQPGVALALPKGTAGATLEIEARSREEAKALQLGPFPARNLQLGLHSFPEYGSHRVEITCVFDNDMQLFTIDFLPEDRPETSEEITVLHFTPTRLKREWTWWAQSPFRAGFRYRTHRSPDESPTEWSEIRSPFEPLEIRVETNLRGDQ